MTSELLREMWSRLRTVTHSKIALKRCGRNGVKLGAPSYGWRRTRRLDCNGRRIIEPVESELRTLQRIVELRENGYTLRAICETLTAENHPTKNHGRWQPNTAGRIYKRSKWQEATISQLLQNAKKQDG